MNDWILYPSRRGFMLIEEDGSEDGRLVADNLKQEDAELIVEAVRYMRRHRCPPPPDASQAKP